MRQIRINTRYLAGGQTYIAGPVQGKTASATSGPGDAARRLADKLFGPALVRLDKAPVQPGQGLFDEVFIAHVNEAKLATPQALPRGRA